MPRFTVLVAAVVTAGCLASLPAKAPAGPSLTESINARVKELDAFPWTSRRPLVWTDFKGQPPRESPAAAETGTCCCTVSDARVRCSKTRVVAAFRPDHSWVRPEILKWRPTAPVPCATSRRISISQRFTRAACDGTFRARCAVPHVERRSVRGGPTLREGRGDAQEKDDAETDHGRKSAEQARWDKDVDGQLTALGRYISPGNAKQ